MCRRGVFGVVFPQVHGHTPVRGGTAHTLAGSIVCYFVLACKRVGCANLCRYQIIERANALAERVAPRVWSATTQPLCAFVRSSRLFFYLPSTATAFSALAAACSQEMVPTLRAVAAAVAAKEQVGWAAPVAARTAAKSAHVHRLHCTQAHFVDILAGGTTGAAPWCWS